MVQSAWRLSPSCSQVSSLLLLRCCLCCCFRYLDEKRAAMPGVKIVTELEPVKEYYPAEVRRCWHAGLTGPQWSAVP